MKKKLFLAGTILVMSAAAAVGYKVYNQSQMSAFMKANIEALTDAESGSGLLGTCANEVANSCLYKCQSCGAKWAQFKPGSVKRIHGYCDCGARIDYEKQ